MNNNIIILNNLDENCSVEMTIRVVLDKSKKEVVKKKVTYRLPSDLAALCSKTNVDEFMDGVTEVCQCFRATAQQAVLQAQSELSSILALNTPEPEGIRKKSSRCMTTRPVRVLSKSGVFVVSLPWYFARDVNSTEILDTSDVKAMKMKKATSMSFRDTADFMNDFMGQSNSTDDALRAPVTIAALRNAVERYGRQLYNSQKQEEAQILAKAGYDPKTYQLASQSRDSKKQNDTQVPLEYIVQVMQTLNAQDITIPFDDCKMLATLLYNSVFVTIDGVLVPRQKEEHGKGTVRDSKNVLQYTAVLMHKDLKRYFVAGSAEECLMSINAFILNTPELRQKDVHCITDGEKKLKELTTKIFSYTQVYHNLDYFHFRKNIDEKITAALKGSKEDKEAFISLINAKIWEGNHKQALNLLCMLRDGVQTEFTYENKTSTCRIRSPDSVQLVIDYYQRCYTQLVPFAASRALGLTIASSMSEMSNDLLITDRQKNNHSSWTKNGSLYLAFITAALHNEEL